MHACFFLFFPFSAIFAVSTSLCENRQKEDKDTWTTVCHMLAAWCLSEKQNDG